MTRVVAPDLGELIDVVRGDLRQWTELTAGGISEVTAPLVLSNVLITPQIADMSNRLVVV